MTINAIIDQNDQTLAYFGVHDYYNAIESSARALSYLHQRRQNSGREGERQQAGMDDSTRSATDSLDECMLLQLQVEENQPNSYSLSLQTRRDGSFIYKQGIPIPPAVSQDESLVTSILIFNSALAHHLAAETPEIQTPPETMHKAKRLYMLASSIDRIAESVCFQFAVINNMAVLERKLGNTALSNEYFDYLASIAERADATDSQEV